MGRELWRVLLKNISLVLCCFAERKKGSIPPFWPILITFAFLSLLQLGGMQFYLLHSGNVVWPTSVADYSVRFCNVSLRLAMSPQHWLGLFFPQNPQHRAHVNCSSTVGWKVSMSAHSHLWHTFICTLPCKPQYSHTGGSEKRIFCTWDCFATTKQKNKCSRKI